LGCATVYGTYTTSSKLTIAIRGKIKHPGSHYQVNVMSSGKYVTDPVGVLDYARHTVLQGRDDLGKPTLF
jgi:hypothetical protein